MTTSLRTGWLNSGSERFLSLLSSLLITKKVLGVEEEGGGKPRRTRGLRCRGESTASAASASKTVSKTAAAAAAAGVPVAV